MCPKKAVIQLACHQTGDGIKRNGGHVANAYGVFEAPNQQQARLETFKSTVSRMPNLALYLGKTAISDACGSAAANVGMQMSQWGS